MTMMFLLAFRTGYIRNTLPEHIDTAILTGASTLLLLASVYSAVVVNTFWGGAGTAALNNMA